MARSSDKARGQLTARQTTEQSQHKAHVDALLTRASAVYYYPQLDGEHLCSPLMRVVRDALANALAGTDLHQDMALAAALSIAIPAHQTAEARKRIDRANNAPASRRLAVADRERRMSANGRAVAEASHVDMASEHYHAVARRAVYKRANGDAARLRYLLARQPRYLGDTQGTRRDIGMVGRGAPPAIPAPLASALFAAYAEASQRHANTMQLTQWLGAYGRLGANAGNSALDAYVRRLVRGLAHVRHVARQLGISDDSAWAYDASATKEAERRAEANTRNAWHTLTNPDKARERNSLTARERAEARITRKAARTRDVFSTSARAQAEARWGKR